MKCVAKAVLIDADGRYLLLERSGHPMYPNDPDLPGGTVEDGEAPEVGVLREVLEETGISVRAEDIILVYRGNEFSLHHTMQYLYEVHVGKQPEVMLSWEHAGFEWVDRDVFLAQARAAKDTYMHMVATVLQEQNINKAAVRPTAPGGV